ncbi:MAG TPA: hypothetical protein VN841_03375 [Bryobacteraceae bacterium]|nr:hypothetical protein [Bryobacteraceae bacterium]
MRRACATLLLALFGFVLGGPALFAYTDSNLPACCRRLGQHHCSMPGGALGSAQTSGPAFQPVLCASFPGALAPPVSAKAGLLKFPGGVTGPIAAHAAVRTASGVRYEAKTRDSHSERGPPAFLS